MYHATLSEVEQAATAHAITVRGIVSRDDGAACVLFIYDVDNDSAIYFSTGFLSNEQQAIDFAYGLMQETPEDLMNLLKNDKLFPNIRGVMLKDKPVTLHLSGRVQITELQGGDARVELFFSDHKKTAVVNRNQALHIIDAHGPETDAWKGKPVVLFAEEGVWFGKRQWGLRVDADATKKAATAEARKEKAEVKNFEKELDEYKEKEIPVVVDAGQAPLFDDSNGAYQD